MQALFLEEAKTNGNNNFVNANTVAPSFSEAVFEKIFWDGISVQCLPRIVTLRN